MDCRALGLDAQLYCWRELTFSLMTFLVNGKFAK